MGAASNNCRSFRKEDYMFDTNTTKCSCGCGNKCGFNPCAVTCGNCVQGFGDYAYIYNTAAETIAADAAATFSSNGLLSGTITHTAGTENIVIGKTGVYMIDCYLDGGEAESSFTVYSNGEPIQGSTYALAGGAANGQLIVQAQTGDVITLVNTGANTVTLTSEGTTPEAVVNASVKIVRLF